MSIIAPPLLWQVCQKYLVYNIKSNRTKLLHLLGKREQDPCPCASEEKEAALSCKKRQKSKDGVDPLEETRVFGPPALSDSTQERKPPEPTLKNKRASVSVRSYPVCALHLNQSTKASHYRNWSSGNQMVSISLSLLRRASPRSSSPVRCCWWSNQWKTAGER